MEMAHPPLPPPPAAAHHHHLQRPPLPHQVFYSTPTGPSISTSKLCFRATFCSSRAQSITAPNDGDISTSLLTSFMPPDPAVLRSPTSSASASPPPPSWLHQQQQNRALLQQIHDTLELEQRQSSAAKDPMPSTSTDHGTNKPCAEYKTGGRAVAACLQDARDMNDVDAVLHNLHFPAHVYTAAIQKLGQLKKPYVAFFLFQWLVLSRPDILNVFIYSSLFGVMKTRGAVLKHFAYVMEQMRKHVIQPNLITYNNIIECYERQHLHTEAMETFRELTEKGLSPTHATFRAILWGSTEGSDVARALQTYRLARDILTKAGMNEAAEELRVEVSSFHADMVSASMLADKGPDYVISLLDMADASGLAISPPDYDEILWDCCGSRKMDFIIAKHVLSRRRKACSLTLDVRVCNHVMKLMGKVKKWWAALEVFETMERDGPEPDAESYSIIRSHFNILLAASKKRGTSSWNVQLLEKMEEHGFIPDRFAWDTSLVACAMSVDPKSAVDILQKMIEKGHQPNVLSYGALLSTLEKSGLIEKAELVWEHMKTSKVKPNINVYTIMVSVYGAAQKHEELDRLLLEMRESDVNFTLVTYNTLITVCAKAGDAKGAHKWMLELIADGFMPDSISYSQLIIALRRGGREGHARDMYMKAKLLDISLALGGHEYMSEIHKSQSFRSHPNAIASFPQHEDPDMRILESVNKESSATVYEFENESRNEVECDEFHKTAAASSMSDLSHVKVQPCFA